MEFVIGKFLGIVIFTVSVEADLSYVGEQLNRNRLIDWNGRVSYSNGIPNFYSGHKCLTTLIVFTPHKKRLTRYLSSRIKMKDKQANQGGQKFHLVLLLICEYILFRLICSGSRK
jgi:hypothetical protein